jgi:hypothetical protein
LIVVCILRIETIHCLIWLVCVEELSSHHHLLLVCIGIGRLSLIHKVEYLSLAMSLATACCSDSILCGCLCISSIVCFIISITLVHQVIYIILRRIEASHEIIYTLLLAGVALSELGHEVPI